MKVLPKSVLYRFAATSGILFLMACSGGPSRAPYVEDADDTVGVGANALSEAGSAGCVEGTIEQCLVKLPSQGNVESCFEGYHQCIEGRWGPCVAAEDLEIPLLEDGT